MKFRKPTLNLRINELSLFKWKKEGIILTYGIGFKKHIINISDNMSKDKDGCLNWLYELLDEDIPEQQKRDIKEVISEFIDKP